MRILVALCIAACLLTSSSVDAQDVPSRETDHGAGILASAERAALGVELQPNAAPQRTRRKGRLYGGLTMLAIGGGIIALSVAGGSGTEYGSTEETIAVAGFWTGIGIAAFGGVMTALADTTSRVRDGQGEPDERFLHRRHRVVPLSSREDNSKELSGIRVEK